eukprot:gene16826-18524_t
MLNVKHLVSKKKKRYVQDGFDLDLTYIKPNIAAMGFPAEKLEGVYRNNIDEVVRFLETKHKDHYKLYNLCSEKTYDTAKFHHRVSSFPFDDHNAPPFELIQPFCEDMDKYLNSHGENVAMVHCKAGKGRTGVMICSYLIHSGYAESTRDALRFYGNARTLNQKGVTIPSQRRYVEYYGHFIRNRLQYAATTILLCSFEMNSIPNISNGGCTPYFIIWQKGVKLYQSKIFDTGKRSKTIKCPLSAPIPVCGDIKVEFYHKDWKNKERILIFWFNTFFVKCGYTPDKPDGGGEKNVIEKNEDGSELRRLSLAKEDLDKANKDKKHKVYPPDFRMEVTILVPDVFCPDESDNAKIQSIRIPLNNKGICETTSDEDDTRSCDLDIAEDLSEDETDEWDGEPTTRYINNQIISSV